MRRFKSILLYANRGSSSCAALRRAEALAAENQALLYVVDVLPGPEEARWTARRILRSRQTEVDARLKELGTMVVPAWRRGVAVQVEVLVGKPFAEIIRAVLRNGHDLVVLNADAREGRPGDPQARTALRLVRECPCPVWAIKGDESGPHRRVLAAVDAGEDWSGDQKETRAKCAVSSLKTNEPFHSVVLINCCPAALPVDCSLLTVKPEGFVSPIQPVGVLASGGAIGNG